MTKSETPETRPRCAFKHANIAPVCWTQVVFVFALVAAAALGAAQLEFELDLSLTAFSVWGTPIARNFRAQEALEHGGRFSRQPSPSNGGGDDPGDDATNATNATAPVPVPVPKRSAAWTRSLHLLLSVDEGDALSGAGADLALEIEAAAHAAAESLRPANASADPATTLSAFSWPAQLRAQIDLQPLRPLAAPNWNSFH